MKRILVVVLFILFLFLTLTFKLISNAKDGGQQWSKINNYIYIDKNSITKNNNTASAWFKIYDSPENKLHEINNTHIYYEINLYEVGCTSPITISIAHSKSYDKNNDLIDEYINEQGYACSCPCLVNDDIYVKELCVK